LEIATYLVKQGVCMATPVVDNSHRLAVRDVTRVRAAALSFAQEFGVHIHLFALVSYLSDPRRTLGGAMYDLAQSSLEDAVWIRRMMSPPADETMPGRLQRTESSSSTDESASSEGTAALGNRAAASSVPLGPCTRREEETLYRMALWLISREVLVHVQEYLVASPAHPVGTQKGGSGRYSGSGTMTRAVARIDEDTETKIEDSRRVFERSNLTSPSVVSHHDHQLFRDLMESGCLDGTASIAKSVYFSGYVNRCLRRVLLLS
jgi:hypothetical protein